MDSNTFSFPLYLREAILPPMPTPDQTGKTASQSRRQDPLKAMDWVVPINAPKRRLSAIHRFPGPWLDIVIMKWIENNVEKPDWALEPSDVANSTGRLSIPAPINHPEPHPMRLPLPEDLPSVATWTWAYPLQTSQRAVHILDPSHSNYKFSVDKVEKPDVMWRTEWRIPLDPDSARMMVFVLPPSLRSLTDMENFTSPPSNDKQSRTCLGNARLWARMYDLCWGKHCPWFVVTTYNTWVLGRFSTDFENVFVSRPYESSMNGPTVVEMLVYWISSAMDCHGGFQCPETPAPLLPYPLAPVPRSPTSTRSSWSQESLESAGVASGPCASPSIQSTSLAPWVIEDWVRKSGVTEIPSKSRAGSVVSEASNWSSLTAGSKAGNKAQGQWQWLPLEERTLKFDLAS